MEHTQHITPNSSRSKVIRDYRAARDQYIIAETYYEDHPSAGSFLALLDAATAVTDELEKLDRFIEVV